MSAVPTVPTRTIRHRVAALALAAIATLTLTACGADADSPPPPSDSPSASTTPTADTSSPDSAATATTVAVSGIEYGYVMPEPPTTPGTYTFVLTNDGNMTHNLVLEGVDGASTATIAPGETAEFTVTLEAGDYTLYCSLGNHRAQGMEVSFTVS